MKRLLVIFCAALLLVGLQACNKKPIDLKSPCVGAEKSPCDRRPANAWLNEA